MSRFATAFAASGLPDLFAYFGQAASYSPVTGDDVALTAIIDPEERRVDTSAGMRVSVRTCKATISDDATSEWGGVAAANEAATLTFAGEEWAVETVDKTPGGWILCLIRDELTETARPDYRMEPI